MLMTYSDLYARILSENLGNNLKIQFKKKCETFMRRMYNIKITYFN